MEKDRRTYEREEYVKRRRTHATMNGREWGRYLAINYHDEIYGILSARGYHLNEEELTTLCGQLMNEVFRSMGKLLVNDCAFTASDNRRVRPYFYITLKEKTNVPKEAWLKKLAVLESRYKKKKRKLR